MGGFEQADKILSKTFLYLELNMERDSERGGGNWRVLLNDKHLPGLDV